ncbi:hypothetical protein D3H34_32265 [Acidovorax cavernicola]|uniref:Uncharacterized protein n=2 Tax=Acidovorax cavernicola TaxID=1675792 RepID=A0A9X8GRS0_9BURK|nr:hypothetical protein D3H34_32265 [Acidovorax cavernicola]
MYLPTLGETVFDFTCAEGPKKCLVMLGVASHPNAGFLDPDKVTTANAIEQLFLDLFDEPQAVLVDEKNDVVGADRLKQTYIVSLSGTEPASGLYRKGLSWFTDNKRTWAMLITVPDDNQAQEAAENARSLALGLIQSTRTSHGN